MAVLGLSRSSLVFLALCCAGPPRLARAQLSMMRREARSARAEKSALQASLEGVLQGEAAQRLLAVEASVRPSYEAFPKNSLGRIPPAEIFPTIVRGYFAKEHGWLLKGLEPPSLAPRLSEVHEARVLLQRAPALAEALKQLHDSDRGLSLSDVVATVAAIEHLLLDESAGLLRGAYALHGRPEVEAVDEEGLHEVLTSYLLLFRHGRPHNFTDVGGHRRLRERAREASDWAELSEFARGAVRSSGLAGPYAFSAVAQVVRDLALAYGKWQNSECVQMKAALLGLGADASGAVPLARFRAEPKHASFQFTESAEYLRRTGALQESEGHEPQVLVANYLLGPSNCIAPSEHYSVCCLSECETLTSELELRAQAPALHWRQLLDVVAGAAASLLGAPRELPRALAQDLEAIAGRHEGAVPLHSADFRRWLHKAFPSECPLPTAADSAAEESERATAEEWLAVQQECTRIPQWHPSAQGEVVSV